MGPYGDDATEALLCGHVCHSECIQNWMKVSKAEKWQSCPYKCHLTRALADQRLADLSEDPREAANRHESERPSEAADEGSSAAIIIQ